MRYTLRTLLALSMGAAVAWGFVYREIAAFRNEWREDREALVNLGPACFATSYRVDFQPTWLRYVLDEKYCERTEKIQIHAPRNQAKREFTDEEWDLSHFGDCIKRFVKCRELDLEAPVRDDELLSLAGMKELRSLSIGSDRLTDAGMRVLPHFTRLESLSLTRFERGAHRWDRAIGGRNLTDATLDSVATLPELVNLNRHDMKITGAGVEKLSKLPRLRTLSLLGSRCDDQSLAALASLDGRLQTLNLKRTSISDAGLPHLAQIQSLNSLILIETNVTDAGMEIIAKMPALIDLGLDGTRVTLKGLRKLYHSTSLNFISVDESGVAEESFEELAEFHARRKKGLPGLPLAEP